MPAIERKTQRNDEYLYRRKEPIIDIRNTRNEYNTKLRHKRTTSQNHHKFVEDESVNNENGIENELKSIQCNNLHAARYTTALITESCGLLAAKAISSLPAIV